MANKLKRKKYKSIGKARLRKPSSMGLGKPYVIPRWKKGNQRRYNLLYRSFIYGIVFPFVDSVIQWLTGTTDGEVIDDSETVVTPEPEYINVPCYSFDGTHQCLASMNTPTSYVPKPVRITLRLRTTVTGDAVVGITAIARENGNNWCGVYYDSTVDKFNAVVTDAGTGVTGDVVGGFNDGEWHDLVYEQTLSNVSITLDGNEVLSGALVPQTSSHFSDFIVGGLGTGGLAGFEFTGEIQYAKIEYWFDNPDTGYVAPAFFDGWLDTGYGKYIPSDLAEASPLVVPDLTAWIEVSNTTSGKLLHGHTKAYAFDDVDDEVYYNSTSGTRIDEVEFTIYITGEASQPIFQSDRNSLQAHTANNASSAIFLSFFLSGSIFTQRSRLEAGWHTIRFVYVGGVPSYEIWIDGVNEPLKGSSNYAGIMTLSDCGFPESGSSGFNKMNSLIADCWLKHTDSQVRYIIKDGVVDCTNIGNRSDWVVVGGQTVFASKNADGKYYDGGYVHNQSGEKLIQSSPDIIDAVFVTGIIEEPDGLLLIRNGTETGKPKYNGTGSAGAYELRATGAPNWYLDGPALIEDFNGNVGPLPPTTGWTFYTYYHGYEGSIWVDEYGEYKELGWDDLNNHTTGSLNTYKLYEKAGSDTCHIKEMVTTSSDQRITVDDFDSLNVWQGSSGCEPLVTYAVDVDSNPLYTTNGSLIIITT